jgi:hypothetical protein
MFKFKDGTTVDQVDAYLAALRTLPEKIPEIVDYKCGRDVGVNEGNFDAVVTGDFASTDHYLVYRDDPEHQKIVREMGVPMIDRRSMVQFEW